MRLQDSAKITDQEPKNASDYQAFGWQHELWDVVRYFRSIGKNEKKLREFWLDYLREKSSLAVIVTGKSSKKCEIHGSVPLKKETIDLFFKYLADSENQYGLLRSCLRTEAEALSFCERLAIKVEKTTTRSQEHHQSSKSLVAVVAQVSSEIAAKFGFNIDIDPQHRCVWFKERDLHVTARNLDGAIPCLVNPFVVWEIKEYWGQTKGGSKMSVEITSLASGYLLCLALGLAALRFALCGLGGAAGAAIFLAIFFIFLIAGFLAVFRMVLRKCSILRSASLYL
jgi:hypothetical protein